jgi:hypothetical protein
VSPAGAAAASRVLVVGQDADVSIALHLHLERAGFAVFCVPGPHEVEAIARAVAPHVVVLLLPAAPDGTWGGALTMAQNAAKIGVRVVMVAPSREVVEPLAAVAGAERALARSEVLSRPLVVVERSVSNGLVGGPPPVPPPTRGEPGQPPVAPPPAARGAGAGVDLMALIDEELVDEPKARPVPTRVEVNVSLVSEHNFYVGQTRRMDSGGVFIAVGAGVEAPGRVRPHQLLQAALRQLLLERRPDGLAALRAARAPRIRGVAAIFADEDVMAEAHRS